MATNDRPDDPNRAPRKPAEPDGAAPLRPGDEAAPGSPGTGETLCRECGGSGRDARGNTCPQCEGTGKITVGIGGG